MAVSETHNVTVRRPAHVTYGADWASFMDKYFFDQSKALGVEAHGSHYGNGQARLLLEHSHSFEKQIIAYAASACRFTGQASPEDSRGDSVLLVELVTCKRT